MRIDLILESSQSPGTILLIGERVIPALGPAVC
jgi:hypothetical protein